MRSCIGWTSFLAAATAAVGMWSTVPACCPAPSENGWAVNADQTVVILWDAARKTQHFVRQASFLSDDADFGFLIPSPSRPELAEADDAAFQLLREFTKPAVEYRRRPAPAFGCGCAEPEKSASVVFPPSAVKVLEEKRVAGFDAAVLDASSTEGLIDWLKDHGYAYSPQVAAWAKPYVEQGWKITALKVAKTDGAASQPVVDAPALRMSFVTDRPLFPYREPDYGATVKADARRMLRIFFLGEGRYDGSLSSEGPAWTGRPVWSDGLSAEQRAALLAKLQLPADTGPTELRLTEFEDVWPYRVAPSDLAFATSTNQAAFHRPPLVVYTASASGPWPTDAAAYVLAALVATSPVWRRRIAQRLDRLGTHRNS